MVLSETIDYTYISAEEFGKMITIRRDQTVKINLRNKEHLVSLGSVWSF